MTGTKKDSQSSQLRSTDPEAQLRALNGLIRVAVSTIDMSEVVDRISEQVKKLIDHDRLSISVRPPGEDYVEVFAVAASARPIFDKGFRWPLHEVPMGEVILTGQPILRTSIPHDVAYAAELELAKVEGYRSTMYVPLESKGRVIGTLNLGSRHQVFSEQELHIAQEIADHLAVVVKHALLYEESKQLATLQERARLASELHDALAGSFVGIILELDLARRMMRTDAATAQHQIDRARQMAHEGLEEARQLIPGVRPPALETTSMGEPMTVVMHEEGEQRLTETLTSREREVLGLLARGLRNKEIARELEISEATVRFHVAHVFEKLGVGRRTEALIKALELGIITIP